MKLSELKPQLEKEYTHLTLDCPVCQAHRIEVPIEGRKSWMMTYEGLGLDLDTITLRPSVANKTHYADTTDKPPRLCESHFFITGGEVEIL